MLTLDQQLASQLDDLVFISDRCEAQKTLWWRSTVHRQDTLSTANSREEKESGYASKKGWNPKKVRLGSKTSEETKERESIPTTCTSSWKREGFEESFSGTSFRGLAFVA